MTWQERAACRDAPTELFFPERGQSVAPARAYCDRCEVRQECLAYRLANPTPFGDPGIWGGTSERERRRLRCLNPDLQRRRAS